MPSGFHKLNRALVLVVVLWLLAATGLTARADGAAAGADALQQARAHWLKPSSIAWDVPANAQLRLHFSTKAGLEVTATGVTGGEEIPLTRDGVVAGSLAA